MPPTAIWIASPSSWVAGPQALLGSITSLVMGFLRTPCSTCSLCLHGHEAAIIPVEAACHPGEGACHPGEAACHPGEAACPREVAISWPPSPRLGWPWLLRVFERAGSSYMQSACGHFLLLGPHPAPIPVRGGGRCWFILHDIGAW